MNVTKSLPLSFKVEPILSYCAWHRGWYDRLTGKQVTCDAPEPDSHGICQECSRKELEKARAYKAAGYTPVADEDIGATVKINFI
jgi:hypothetical protein